MFTANCIFNLTAISMTIFSRFLKYSEFFLKNGFPDIIKIIINIRNMHVFKIF